MSAKKTVLEEIKFTFWERSRRKWKARADYGETEITANGYASSADVACARATQNLIRACLSYDQEGGGSEDEPENPTTNYKIGERFLVTCGKHGGEKCTLEHFIGPYVDERTDELDEKWRVRYDSGKTDIEKMCYLQKLPGKKQKHLVKVHHEAQAPKHKLLSPPGKRSL